MRVVRLALSVFLLIISSRASFAQQEYYAISLACDSVCTFPTEMVLDKEYSIPAANLLSFDDTTCRLTLAEMTRQNWSDNTPDIFHQDYLSCHWLWVRVSVPAASTSFDDQKWMVETGYHGLSKLYIVADDSLIYEATSGNDLPISQRNYPFLWAQAYKNLFYLPLEAGKSYDLYVSYSDLKGQSLYGTNDALQLTFLSEQSVNSNGRLHLFFSGLMVGGMLLLLLYQMAQWSVYRTELDVTYCLMLVGLTSFILYDDFLLHAAFSTQVIGEKWLYFTGSLGLVFFFRFAQLTLRAVDYQPKKDKILGYLVIEKAAETILFFSMVTLAQHKIPALQPIVRYIPETFRVLLLISLFIFSWIVISHFKRNEDNATKAFLIGNLSLVTGVVVVVTRAYILSYRDNPVARIWIDIITPAFEYIIEIGIVGMALCFAFAIALLTKERELGLERTYSQRLAEAQMNALRSQMNPHFLFNGLNSIKSFVISNKPREAGDYLSKFARLIRLILENSKAKLIPLSREIETLELYIKMESLRFSEKFSYSIEVGPEVEPHTNFVPPTLIQPYVENAIWHGLLNRNEPGGHLIVKMNLVEGGKLRFIVQDNGIGRKAAELKKPSTPNRHKSMGMQITADRIEMLKQIHGFEATVEVTDLYTRSGDAIGTRVTIDFLPTSEDHEVFDAL